MDNSARGDMTADVRAMASGDTEATREESLEQYVGRMSMRFAIPAGVLMALLVLLLNLDRDRVPFGEDVTSFAIITFFAIFPLALISAGWGFILGVRAWNARVEEARYRRWGWALVPVSLAYMLFAAGVLVVVFEVVEYAFRELSLPNFQAALLVGVGTSAFIAWLVTNAMMVNSGRLLSLLTMLLAGGIYLTAVTIQEPQWWRFSFSYLGSLDSNVHAIFNGTLLFAGILTLIWHAYFHSDYRILLRNGIADVRWEIVLRYAVIGLGVAVMTVGLVKWNLNAVGDVVHNIAAYSVGGIFCLLMGTVHWYVPRFPREFHILSWILVAVIVVTLGWSNLGGVNTVGVEIISFTIGLMWLSQFTRNTENLAEEVEPEAFPE